MNQIFFLLIAMILPLSQPQNQCFAIPGMSYALQSGRTRSFHQQQLAIQRTICQSSCNQPISSALPMQSKSNPNDAISNLPQLFVADTDSIPIIMDTGANRIIVNDKNLL